VPSRFSRLLLLILAIGSGIVARADVTLPKVLSSHMVLERDLPVHVWGWAVPLEPVSVTFRGATQTTVADDLGMWSVFLPPGGAGGPFDLTINAINTIKLEDVLVGDVWLASGQSNMEFRLRQAATGPADLPGAAIDHIRLLLVKTKAADAAEPDIETASGTTGWVASTPETAAQFSAIGWYFARDLQQREHVPIGVIDSTWGGTVADAWTRLAALGEAGGLDGVFSARGHMTDRETRAAILDEQHKKAKELARAAGKPEPQFPWHPSLNSWGPGMLYNGMIAPLTPFPIRGVIWYQGESNSALERAPIYGRVFRTMIEDWRRQWQIGDFPFLFVQIANFKSSPSETWAPIREAQRQTLELRNTGMAVTIDIGNPDDVHPTDKLTVGTRLALAARAISYGETVEYSGPLFRQVTPEGSSIRVWFEHAQGLEARGVLTGFEVAGEDGVFAPAEARIDGDTVVLTSAAVVKPLAARYGWANSPECHLYNRAGLPASPFNSIP
jgi:sialate O-acetylesterase